MASLQRRFNQHLMRQALEQEPDIARLLSAALMVLEAYIAAQTMLEWQLGQQLGFKPPAEPPNGSTVSE
jgi:hypothetical protein